MNKHVINLDEVTIEERPTFFQATGEAKQRYASQHGQVSTRIGARLLGYNVTVVPPGMRAFPLHNHHANEEMFFILEGKGELRTGEERSTVRAGDFICSPPGGPELAHQLINTGSGELKYLAVSTMIYPEMVEYPDSGKLAMISRQPKADGTQRVIRHISRESIGLGYWEGE